MASELLAWMQMLAVDGPARAWEPKRLGLRLFTAAGRLARRPPAAPRRDLALGHPADRRDHPPAVPCPRLTSQNHPTTRKGHRRARGTLPTRRDSRAARHSQTLKTANGRSLNRADQGRETPRLVLPS